MPIVTHVNQRSLVSSALDAATIPQSTVLRAVLDDLDFQPKVRLLLLIQAQAEPGTEGWTAPVSFLSIADALRVDRKTVMRGLHALLMRGYITRQRAGQMFRYRLQEQLGTGGAE